MAGVVTGSRFGQRVNGWAEPTSRCTVHWLHDRQGTLAALIEAVTTHFPGRIGHAQHDGGGEYRRNM